MWHGYHTNTRTDDYINATVSSAGTATGYVGPCPEGYCWYIERMTCYSNTAATAGVLEVYSIRSTTPPNDTSKQGRVDMAKQTAVANSVSDENSPIVVQAGYFLVAAWSGLTSGDLVALSMQIRVHKLEVGQNDPLSRHMFRGDEKHDMVKPVIVGDQVAEV